GVEVKLAFVGVQLRLAADVFGDDFLNGALVGGLWMEGAPRATALDQRNDGTHTASASAAHFVGPSLARGGHLRIVLPPEIGLVSLNSLAAAAQGRKTTLAQGLTNAVAHGPR